MSTGNPQADLEAVIRSAALAATEPPAAGAERLIDWAAAAAARAARRGGYLPLPLLLDIRNLWLSDEPPSSSLRATPPGSQAARDYLDWLLDWDGQCGLWLSRDLRVGDLSREGWDPVPLLAGMRRTAAEGNGGTPPRLAAEPSAFALLGAEPHRTKVRQVWANPAGLTDPALLDWLGALKDGQTSLAGVLWSLWNSRHAGNSRAAWLDQAFDHEAARLYLGAPDLQPTAAQHGRITHLRRRRPSAEIERFPTSYEDLNPYCGHYTLATLTQGTLGEHKIVNDTDIRLAGRPRVRPPRALDIRLHWAFGPSGLLGHHAAPAFGDGPLDPAVRPQDDSLLQGFAALVLDDWRDALQGLPIEFHAGPLNGPAAGSDRYGKGGPRWKPRESLTGILPPARMVTRFFTRCDWVALTQVAPHDPLASPDRSWGVLTLLECDLPYLGFDQADARDGRGWPTWEVREGGTGAGVPAIPAAVSLVILIGSAAGDGWLCRVRRHRGLLLEPSQRIDAKTDFGLKGLRSAALDHLLGDLGRLLR
jgi:hypothetical protein